MPKFNYRKIRYKLSIIILVVLLLLILVPTNSAHAGITDTIFNLTIDPIIRNILFFFWTIMIDGLAGLQKLLTLSLRWGVLNSSNQPFQVVTDSWNIMRNFANMFFIVGLIIMAFATIFSIGQYDFRKLIVKLLIAALLINFSLTIGTTIISWSQSFSNVLLNSIGDFGNRLGEGLKPGNLTGTEDANLPLTGVGIEGDRNWWNNLPTDQKTNRTLVSMFFSIIIGGIAIFALLVGVVVSIVRIPILMALLIISPIAWILMVMPQTTQWNRKWWSEFIGWNLFLPVYLFFIYFGILFLNRQNEIFSSSDIAGQTTLDGIGWKFQEIFAYILAAIFLVGGAKIALGMKNLGGAAAIAGATWTKGWANARLARGTWTRKGAEFGFGATGIPGAYKEAKEYVQEKGLAGTKFEKIPIIGRYKGRRGLEEKQAAIAGAFGIPGVAEKQFQKNIKYSEENYERQFRDKKLDEKGLKTIAGNTKLPLEERVAAANKLKDLGENVAGGDLAALYGDYAKLSPAEAVRWIRSQNIDNLNPTDLDALDTAALDLQLKQRIAKIKNKRNLLGDADNYISRLKLFTDKEGEAVSFIGETNKDFTDNLKKREVVKILKHLKEQGWDEASKKFAMQIAEKGFFTGAKEGEPPTEEEALLKSMVMGGATGHGSFNSETEAGKFLDLVKKANLAEASRLKQEKGLLTDMYEKDASGQPVKLLGKMGLQKAIQQELAKANNEELAKMIQVEQGGIDPITGLTKYRVKDNAVLLAFQQSLRENPKAAKKIQNMYADPKFTSNTPLMGALDGAIKDIQRDSFEKDRGEPFKQKIDSVLVDLIPKLEKAIEDNSIEEARTHAKQATRNLDDAEKLIKGIERMDFITSTKREELEHILSDSKERLEKAKKKKQKGPEDPDKTPPTDNNDKGPKGPKGGSGGEGGGSSSGGVPLRPGERLSKGGIILTPGTQYEMRRPRPQPEPTPEPQNTRPNPPQHLGGPTVIGGSKAGTIPSGEIGRPPESDSKPVVADIVPKPETEQGWPWLKNFQSKSYDEKIKSRPQNVPKHNLKTGLSVGDRVVDPMTGNAGIVTDVSDPTKQGVYRVKFDHNGKELALGFGSWVWKESELEEATK